MVIVADLLLFKIASDQIPISVKQLSLATSLNKIHVFIKSIFIIHKIYFHRRVLQNSCSPTIKILEKCLLQCSLINKVTSRMPSTLSKINSFTCIFQLFWTQVLNSHFADHVSVAASEHIVHTFSVKWFRYFHFYTSPYNEFVFHLFLFAETLLLEVVVRGLAVLKSFFKVVTTLQLQIYPFIQNSRKRVFKRGKNQKNSLELFWEKEMFLKIAVCQAVFENSCFSRISTANFRTPLFGCFRKMKGEHVILFVIEKRRTYILARKYMYVQNQLHIYYKNFRKHFAFKCKIWFGFNIKYLVLCLQTVIQ